MPRPRLHDPETALHRAMQLFWSQGFRRTSVQDLVDGTRVQRHGIYQAFGSKDDLFIAALDRYQDTVVQRVVAPLLRPGAGLPAIRRVLHALSRLGQGEGEGEEGAGSAGAKGCLVCNTAGELGRESFPISRQTNRYLRTLREAWTAALLGAHRDGDLRAGTDVATAAEHLTGVTVALCLLARMSGGEAIMRSMVTQTLRSVSATGE